MNTFSFIPRNKRERQVIKELGTSWIAVREKDDRVLIAPANSTDPTENWRWVHKSQIIGTLT